MRMTHLIPLVPCLAALSAVAMLTTTAQSQVGQRFEPEKRVVEDRETGVPMTVLTDGQSSDAKIYQTHPQWTADGKWIVFRSSDRAEGSQAFAVNEESGDVVQLTDGEGNDTGSLNVARKSMKLYFFRHEGGESDRTFTMIELDLERLLADSEADSVEEAASYEREVGALPDGLRVVGGFGIDADEQTAYIGVAGGDVGEHLPEDVTPWEKPEGARMGDGPGGIRAMDLETGEVSVVCDVPFQMGHVQANPWVPGEVLFCWETGGDAPQRMWMVDAEEGAYRPLFDEESLDWVTHEVFVTRDEVMFNLIGHQKRLRVRPTGIAVINVRTNAVELVDQIVERGDDPNNLGVNAAGPESYGGYWHCNGSPDGKWAVGDTFQGDLYLIDRESGERQLLSSDHKMRPDHAHPTFSDDSSKILIQSGHFTDGEKLQLIVLPIPQEKAQD